MVLLFGGNHHQQTIGANAFLSQLNGPIHCTFSDRNGSKGNIIIIHTLFSATLFETIAANMGQQFLGVFELGH